MTTALSFARVPTLSTPTQPLHALRQGEGPRVVCLHSSGGSHAQWHTLAQALAPACEVVALDLHGHGRSPTLPTSAPSSLALDARAAWAAAGCGGVHLVGHSYGAAVALQIALDHPGAVRSLTLYEPVAFGLLQATEPAGRDTLEARGVAEATAWQVSRGDLAGAGQGFVDYWSGEGAWAAMPAPRQAAVAQRMPTVSRHFEALFAARWRRAQLSRLGMPTLLLAGDSTRAPTRRIAALLSQSLPQSRLIVMPGMGHLGPLTHAQTVADTMLAVDAPLGKSLALLRWPEAA